MELQTPPVFPRKQVIALVIGFLICLLIVIFSGCKKNFDTEVDNLITQQSTQFFQLPADAPPEAQVIVTAMQRQLNTENIRDFLSWHGQPEWNRVVKLYPATGGPATYLIPTMKTGSVTAFVGATVVSGSKVLFELHRKSSLLSGASEFSYAGITPVKSSFFLNYFDGKPAVATAKNLTGGSNLVPMYCWWDYEIIACTEFAGTDSSSSNFAAPQPCYGWVEHCEPIDDGDSPGGGGSGGGGGGEPGGGGGGNGGGNGGEQCPLWYSLLPPVDPCEPDRDENGYLYSRIAELNLKLQQNEFALEPCDSLNIMPLDPDNGYGLMYQRIAQFKPSLYVKERVDSLRNLGIFNPDLYNITSMSHAYGSVVNCDFFPVRITQIPNGFTPESLVEYFRKNINQFIDANINVSFSPYNDGVGFNDTARFNAYEQNAIGALIHIAMVPNDGSVVLSNYYHNMNSGYNSHKFMFTTMSTPLDYDHPVAGNREFGIYKSTDLQHPNDFVFYTMAVDRMSDWEFALGDWINHEVAGNATGFEQADLLWENIQKNMINFINANGGHSEYYTRPSVKARPQYADVRDYLKGLISWETLKQLLGC